MPSHNNQVRMLALAVLITLGIFPLVVLALNLAQLPDGYSAGRNAVSELALGRGGALMALAFSSLGSGTLLFAVLLHRTSRKAAARTTLLGLAGILSYVSATFHTDRASTPVTAHGEIHNIAGIVTFACMLVVMAVSAWRFRRDPAWFGLAAPTTVLTIVGVVAFFLVPALGEERFGVSQRLLIGAFLVWMLSGAAYRLKTAVVTTASEAVGSAQTA